ncbi:MAG: hypothetical protein Q4B86_05540 [Eubacteriales bacterium]|nr:hypothetical protein [Eubacteriales bacterium]
MRRIHKIAAGVFLIGVLFTGIGTGVALAEFSNLSYGGRIEADTANYKSKELVYTLAEDERYNRIYVDSYWRNDSSIEFVEKSEAFPDNTIALEIYYDAGAIEPELYVDNEIEEGEIYISVHYNQNSSYDAFSEVLNVKDKILEGLKDKKIYSYDGSKIKSIKVKASENLRGKIVY